MINKQLMSLTRVFSNFSVRVHLIQVSAEKGFVIKGNIRRSFRDRLSVRLIEGVRLIGGPLNRGVTVVAFKHLAKFF